MYEFFVGVLLHAVSLFADGGKNEIYKWDSANEEKLSERVEPGRIEKQTLKRDTSGHTNIKITEKMKDEITCSHRSR